MLMPKKFYFGKIPGSTLNSFSGKIMQIKGGKGALITTAECFSFFYLISLKVLPSSCGLSVGIYSQFCLKCSGEY